MNSDSTITISLIIAIVGCLIGVYGFFQSYKKSIKQDDEELDKHFDVLNSSINSLNESVLKLNFKTDQICSTTNETRTDLKAMKNDIDNLRETQVKHGMNINAMWKLIDELKEKKEN